MPGPAGDRRHRVTFHRRATGTGTRGQRTGTWLPLRTRWAQVVHSPGRELTAARQRFEQTEIVVRVLSPTGWEIRATDRLEHAGHWYEIGAVWPADDDHTELLIAAAGVT